MQLRITFIPTAPVSLPFAFHYQLQSALYSLLSADREYADRLHNKGFGAGSKLFTFGSLRGPYHTDRGNIIFDGRIDFEVRAWDSFFISLVSAALKERGGLRLFSQFLPVGDITVTDLCVPGNVIHAAIGSPAAIRTVRPDRSEYYHSPLDADYASVLNKAFSGKYLDAFGSAPNGSIYAGEFKNIKRTVTRCKSEWVTAWSFDCILAGEPEYLSFLYDTGLGTKNSAGFGMFDVDPALLSPRGSASG